jgi:hypothetical protein
MILNNVLLAQEVNRNLDEFTKKLGVNYNSTYAPVDKLVTFRILMAIAANNCYIIESMDISNAFLKANTPNAGVTSFYRNRYLGGHQHSH